jgi:hypothetical protein
VKHSRTADLVRQYRGQHPGSRCLASVRTAERQSHQPLLRGHKLIGAVSWLTL